MYSTANDTSTDMAVEYAAMGSVEDSGVPEIKLDAVLRDAERMVRSTVRKHLGGVPDPPTEIYIEAASDAEMRVFEYLSTTEGFLRSGGIGGTGGISESYVDLDHVTSIVLTALEDVLGEEGNVSNTAYIDTIIGW